MNAKNALWMSPPTAKSAMAATNPRPSVTAVTRGTSAAANTAAARMLSTYVPAISRTRAVERPTTRATVTATHALRRSEEDTNAPAARAVAAIPMIGTMAAASNVEPCNNLDRVSTVAGNPIRLVSTWLGRGSDQGRHPVQAELRHQVRLVQVPCGVPADGFDVVLREVERNEEAGDQSGSQTDQQQRRDGLAQRGCHGPRAFGGGTNGPFRPLACKHMRTLTVRPTLLSE